MTEGPIFKHAVKDCGICDKEEGRGRGCSGKFSTRCLYSVNLRGGGGGSGRNPREIREGADLSTRCWGRRGAISGILNKKGGSHIVVCSVVLMTLLLSAV